VNGISDKSKSQLKTQLKTKESEAGKQAFTIQAARFEVAKMRKAGFKLLEGESFAPVEWKPIVERLSKHPEIENPCALVNWMNAQGYSPK
jgi:hypothetical protein